MKQTILKILFINLLLASGFMLFFIKRNHDVYQYRSEMLTEISQKNKQDIEKDTNTDIDWRYNALEKVSYNQMVWEFWKPLDSFYPDKSFLK